MSEQVPFYIKEVTLADFKGFRGKHLFSFVDENGEWCRWTVFLGNNNTGKTNLLKAIAKFDCPAFSDKINKSYWPIGLKAKLFGDKKKNGIFSIVAFCNNDKNKTISFKYAFEYFHSRRTRISITERPDLIIYGYGVSRQIEKKGISKQNEETLNAENLFFNTNLINFEDWLFQLDYAAKNKQKKAAIRIDTLKSVLIGDIFPEIKNIRFISDEDLNNYIEFKTEDGWHKMSELGYGYQATLSWMADFCKKMFDRYPNSPNPLKEPAVLLIDEIDLHLHPQWQRGLIQSLSDIFPQTQFIVTTHSPFIIQSMENVNLYTLNRVGDHTEVKHLGNRSYIGWKIEEILSEVMGLDEKIHTDRYNELMGQFDEALDNDDYAKGKEAYDKLMLILHPQSAERKLLDIQFTQLTPAE